MTLSRPGKPAQSSSSAIALIECSVRVSPTLARLIRKSAEKEMSGASAKDAYLAKASDLLREIVERAGRHYRDELIPRMRRHLTEDQVEALEIELSDALARTLDEIKD
jgi:hypothetical protein